MARTARRFALHIYISALFLAVLVGFAGVNIATQYLQTRQMMLSAASVLFGHIESEMRSAIVNRYDSSIFAVDFLSQVGMTNAATLEERMKRLPVLVQALRDQPSLSAAYVGYQDGDFFLVRPIAPGSWLARSLKPPATATYLVQSVDRDAANAISARYLFVDDSLKIVEDRPWPNDVFDPRTRPWYRDAMQSDRVAVTAPYLFFTTSEAGTTFARRNADGRAVAGVDVTLATLSDLLHALRPTASAQLVIFNQQDEVIADADLTHDRSADRFGMADLPRVADLGRPIIAKIAAAEPGINPTMLSIEGQGGTWHGLVARLNVPGAPLTIAVAAPQSELLAQAALIRNRSLLIALAALSACMALTLACSRLASQPIEALTREAASIRSLKFDQPIEAHSLIAEIDLLASTMASMKSTIQRFLGIGAALAGERRFDRLLERLLEETAHLAAARGGAVYLAEPDGTLKCALAHWDDQPATLPRDLHPLNDPGHPVMRAVRDGSRSESIDVGDLGRWYPGFGHADTLAMITVALKNRQGEVVGALMLLQDAAALREAHEREVLALVEALSGTAAAAIDSQRLILEQKRLLESIIELVAGAIDSKSPYTGGHCQRVPELTKMIARAAEAQTEGPFKDFALSEMQWEELHIAAWLHDCGKVTLPEHVIDKATKLETIYDRLHEIRMRFEVIKREAEVACWQAIADGEPRGRRLAELQAFWSEIDEEFAFVASCNEGGEFMAPEKIERLHRIAGRRWTRTLDDQIGLSHEERRRKAQHAPAPLPTQEPVLSDRPEHVLERREQDRIAADNPWGFKVDVPENLYNRGEIYNLVVGRGTLTSEDRYKINEHMVETIRMLSRLPLPRHLSQVVEIAGGHHEKMDGTGYPRRLRRDEMSVPARMMAVADIFEALTAADRPYKPAKTLSESLAIMARMRDDAHIDPDIFDLVLSTKVYLTYAERFLSPTQIDAVDPSQYHRA